MILRIEVGKASARVPVFSDPVESDTDAAYHASVSARYKRIIETAFGSVAIGRKAL